jgi:hypothetical protein
MGPLGVVDDEVIVQHLLHFVNGLKPCAPAFDAEVLVEKGAVEAFDDAVGLGPLDARGAVFDVLKLQVEFKGVLVRPSAELTAIVRQHDFSLGVVFFEGGDDVMVHGVNGGDRQL